MKDEAAKAVDAIIRDLADRRGLKQEWGLIDRETQDEIRSKWEKIVRAALAKYKRARGNYGNM